MQRDLQREGLLGELTAAARAWLEHGDQKAQQTLVAAALRLSPAPVQEQPDAAAAIVAAAVEWIRLYKDAPHAGNWQTRVAATQILLAAVVDWQKAQEVQR